MAAGPGNQMAAGRGSIRTPHAEREQVIEVLKAAFVEGRLTADELDVRLGHAFASRTYAELVAVTADIPVDLVEARPPSDRARAKEADGTRRSQGAKGFQGSQGARGARPPMTTGVKVAICLMTVAVTLVVSYFTSTYAFAMFTFFYFMALLVAGAQILVSRHDQRCRSRRAHRAP